MEGKSNYTYIIIAIVVIVLAGFLGYRSNQGGDSGLTGNATGNTEEVTENDGEEANEASETGESNDNEANSLLGLGGLFGGDDEEEETTSPAAPAGETMTLKVYFNQGSGEGACGVAVARDRVVAKTVAPARAALMAFFDGPTSSETSQGLVSALGDDVEIDALAINSGVATLALSGEVGACAKSPVTETLMQFSTVNSVVVTANGEAL